MVKWVFLSSYSTGGDKPQYEEEARRGKAEARSEKEMFLVSPYLAPVYLSLTPEIEQVCTFFVVPDSTVVLL